MQEETFKEQKMFEEAGTSQRNPKMYGVRPGTIDFSVGYEYKIAALLTIRCIHKDVEDMWIAVKPDVPGHFDDIILHIKDVHSEASSFMLRVKHHMSAGKLKESDFVTPRRGGNFSLLKYLEAIESIEKFALFSSKPSEIIEDLSASGKIYFVVFTNRGIDDIKFLEQHDSAPVSLLNTSEEKGVHKLNPSALPGPILEKASAFANFYLLFNQVPNYKLDIKIMDEILAIANKLGVSRLDLKEVAIRYASHVKQWFIGDSGSHFCFTKQDALHALSELFLHQYAIPLINKPFMIYDDERKSVWNKSIAHQTLIFVEHNETSLKFLIQYIGTEVSRYWTHAIKSWGDYLPSDEQTLFYKEHHYLEHHLNSIVGKNGRLRPFDVYKCLWKTNQLPLLLYSTDIVQSRNIINSLTLSSACKVIVLFEHVEGEKDLSSVWTLEDLDELFRDEVQSLGLTRVSGMDMINILSGKFSVQETSTGSKPVDDIAPLHVAAENGLADEVKMLVKNGADVNVIDSVGNTPLHLAVLHNHHEVVLFLLSEGASMDKQNVQGKTALALAADNGEILKLFLSTLVHKKNTLGALPDFLLPVSIDCLLAENCQLHLSVIRSNNTEAIKEVKDLNELMATDKAKRSVLHMLANYGLTHPIATFYTANYESLQRTMDELKDKDVMADLAQHILQHFTDDSTYDDILGYNPLDYAIAKGALAVADKICAKLTNLPLNIDIGDRKVYFLYCGIFGYKSLFKTLVKYFASRDILCKYVDFPTHLFVMRECDNAILVLARGDRKTMELFAGTKQAIQKCTDELNAQSILNLFESKGIYHDLRFAVIFGTEENVRLCKPTKADVDGNTVLHYAVMYDNPNEESILKLLLATKPEVNKRGKDGNTPLHCAIQHGKERTVKMLGESGADVDATNDAGETPLHIATKHGLEGVVRCLLDLGARILPDKCGLTPLDYAAETGDSNILKWLQTHL